jgi:hypothetical protein
MAGSRWRGVDKRLLVVLGSCWVLGVTTLVVQAVGLVIGNASIYRPAQLVFPFFFLGVVISSVLAARQRARRDDRSESA